VRRNVSHVAFGIPSFVQAGTIHRRVTLCGEIGFPDHVENTSAADSVRLTRASPLRE